MQPEYPRTPSQFFKEFLDVNTPMFLSTPLTEDEHKKAIGRYPPITNLQYQPPDTIPIKINKMIKFQSKQAMSLKRLQYLVLGIFRPMDDLASELIKDKDSENFKHYLYMLVELRLLLRNIFAQMNELRTNIAVFFRSGTSSEQEKGIYCTLEINVSVRKNVFVI